MGRKAGGLYINPKKFGNAGKPCMKEMAQFLGCLSINNNKDDKCMKYKDLLVACAEAQRGKPKNPARTINYQLQRLGRNRKFF
ncbi:hypothetical protein LUZ62_037404 [Rhynchospora pubera]|uniref:IMS import disulfide relay-system CHCH-CHCH-like Cx9C domain-containing protein n=1 Tax=Rhynchospora pubera TaxID=906938 RepID=A0AAV8EI68_9POAL|nr:hypothetical protein LUZ62_057068 [Rhynchospora pubera]KAJ4779271.1 hypothetical protein LUZ62_063528 [Rhynchospora pubera]KAJ4786158.1 hypothetical protein LUZ62_037404 [Rhynchospora pubera]